MHTTNIEHTNSLSNEQDIPWFERKIDEIFFKSLYDWNEKFKRLMAGRMTQEEFRKYTLQERKDFSEQVILMCRKYIAEGIGYKNLAFEISEHISKMAEEKLVKMDIDNRAE